MGASKRRTSAAAPFVELDDESVAEAVSTACQNLTPPITTDAEWGARMADIFNDTAIVNATTVADLKVIMRKQARVLLAYFDKRVKIG